MLRTLKYLGLTLLFTIIVLIGIAVTLMRIIDPNRYKNELSLMFAELLEQPVEIRGDLAWALYPRVRISAKDLRINSTDNGPHPLNLRSALITLRLLPLLSGNLEIISIELRDLTINVTINKDGDCNWHIVNHAATTKKTKNKSKNKRRKKKK